MRTVAPDKPAKATKLTEAEQVRQAQTTIAALHAMPEFDLQHEPWIPILRDATVRQVGLRTLLTDAHRITDIAVPQPLLRAGLRRFLTALTADLIRHDTSLDDDAWERAHARNNGFTAGQVDRLLAIHADHLWLWHPKSPFLQDQRLAESSTKPQADLPIQDMVLHLPSGSTMAWWVKAGEPALDGGLAPAATALLLIARWFYAANGNCGDVRLSNGNTVGSQSGGVFAEGVAPITHAFRVDATSLFRTLVRGLPKRLIGSSATSNPVTAGCAWLDLRQPRRSGDALYLATLNPAAVLLTGQGDDGAVTAWLRGSTPIPGEDAKALRNAANDADQHRISWIQPNGKLSRVKIDPGALRAEAVQQFPREAIGARQLTGVVVSSNCFIVPDRASIDAERLDLLLVTKGGTGSSPVWDDMAGLELPARYVDPDTPNFAEVRTLVAAAFDPKDGAQVQLERAIGDLLARPTPDGWQRVKGDNSMYVALRSKAVNTWFARTATAFDDALDNPAGPAAQRWPDLAYQAARAAFEQVAAPYITSSRYAPRYAVALRHFYRKDQ
jgi:hypothetical protein